jgi:hypothetical protein
MLIKLGTGSCLEIRMKMKSHIKIGNSPFERVEEFKYLGTTLTNQNSIQEETEVRNACYHLVQNLLSSSLLSKNFKNMIYRTIIL